MWVRSRGEHHRSVSTPDPHRQDLVSELRDVLRSVGQAAPQVLTHVIDAVPAPTLVSLLRSDPGLEVARVLGRHQDARVRSHALDFLPHDELMVLARDRDVDVRWNLLDRLEDEARAGVLVPTTLVLELLASSDTAFSHAAALGPLVRDVEVARHLAFCDLSVTADLAASEHLVLDERFPTAFLQMTPGGRALVVAAATRIDPEALAAVLPSWAGNLEDLVAALEALDQ